MQELPWSVKVGDSCRQKAAGWGRCKRASPSQQSQVVLFEGLEGRNVERKLHLDFKADFFGTVAFCRVSEERNVPEQIADGFRSCPLLGVA